MRILFTIAIKFDKNYSLIFKTTFFSDTHSSVVERVRRNRVELHKPSYSYTFPSLNTIMVGDDCRAIL